MQQKPDSIAKAKAKKPSALQAYVSANTGNSIPGTSTTNSNNMSSIPATVIYNVQNPFITDYRATQSISFTDGFTTVDNSNFIAEIVAGSDSSFSDNRFYSAI